MTYYTLIKLQIGEYFKYIPLFITPLKQYKVILRHKWLKQHDPSISWVKETLKFCMIYCRSHYLKYYLPYKYAHDYSNLTRYELPLLRTLNQYNKAITVNYSKNYKDIITKPLKIYII